jgi:glycosyltransferase involved in cell wall biosynthesis
VINKDLVSIVIPVKNEREHIETLIKSLYEQSYRPIEIVVVDGGSSDGTLETVEAMIKNYSCKDFIIKLLKEEDYGPLRSVPNARNIGILNSSGDYLIFLDADVIPVHRDFISKVREALEHSPHVTIRVKPLIDTIVEKAIIAEIIAWYRGYYTQVYHAVKREVFRERMFDPRLGLYEDLDFFDDYLVREKGLRPLNISEELLGEHKPHTIKEFFNEQTWYAKTIWFYLLKHYSYKSMHLWRSLLGPLSPLFLLLTAIMLLPIVNGLISLMVIVFLLYRRIRFWLKVPKEYKELKIFLVLLLLDYFVKPIAWIYGHIKYFKMKLRQQFHHLGF